MSHDNSSNYVKNRTKEIALVIIFASLFVATRQFGIPVVPGIDIRINAIFAYIPATFVSWGYTWVFIFVAAVTGEDPMRSVIGFTVGMQMIYFLSRALPRKWWSFLPFIPTTYCVNLVGALYRDLMGQVPFMVGLPACMIKATGLALASVILVPPILKALVRFGAIDFEEEEKT